MTEQEIKQKVRQEIAKDIDRLELEELEELQEWLYKLQADIRVALIKSINALLSDMTLEALEELEISLAESD